MLCDSAAPTPALAFAASLAQGRAGAITALHVCEPIALPVDVPLTAAAGIVVAWTQERLARVRALTPDFERWALTAEIAHSSRIVAQGPLPEALACAANWHDLIVVERDDRAAWGTVNAIGQLLLGTPLPFIVLPHAHRPATALATIAVAFNGSPESTRALHSALPLLKRARRILLLRGDRRPPFSAIAEAPRFDAAQHLERHGLQFEECPLECGDAHAGEAILDLAMRQHADLLVMGGYGRSRFSEWLLGGATRHVLRSAQLPVLLRH